MKSLTFLIGCNGIWKIKLIIRIVRHRRYVDAQLAYIATYSCNMSSQGVLYSQDFFQTLNNKMWQKGVVAKIIMVGYIKVCTLNIEFSIVYLFARQKSSLHKRSQFGLSRKEESERIPITAHSVSVLRQYRFLLKNYVSRRGSNNPQLSLAAIISIYIYIYIYIYI